MTLFFFGIIIDVLFVSAMALAFSMLAYKESANTSPPVPSERNGSRRRIEGESLDSPFVSSTAQILPCNDCKFHFTELVRPALYFAFIHRL